GGVCGRAGFGTETFGWHSLVSGLAMSLVDTLREIPYGGLNSFHVEIAIMRSTPPRQPFLDACLRLSFAPDPFRRHCIGATTNPSLSCLFARWQTLGD